MTLNRSNQSLPKYKHRLSTKTLFKSTKRRSSSILSQNKAPKLTQQTNANLKLRANRKKTSRSWVRNSKLDPGSPSLTTSISIVWWRRGPSNRSYWRQTKTRFRRLRITSAGLSICRELCSNISSRLCLMTSRLSMSTRCSILSYSPRTSIMWRLLRRSVWRGLVLTRGWSSFQWWGRGGTCLPATRSTTSSSNSDQATWHIFLTTS